jgi:tetratricopeptide (TPR) repeat protein
LTRELEVVFASAGEVKNLNLSKQNSKHEDTPKPTSKKQETRSSHIKFQFHPFKRSHFRTTMIERGTNIVELNAYAVDHLAKGAYSNAIKAFRKALRVLHSQVSSAYNDSNSMQIDDLKLELVACRPAPPSSQGSSVDDNAFTLYSKAFSITNNSEESSLLSNGFLSPDIQNQASLTLLYNMGLSYHLAGVQAATHQKANLDKALRFYKLAYEVASKVVSSPGGTVGFISMAILNNMSNIFAHVFDRDGIYECLEALRLELVAATGPCQLASQDDILHFHMNVVIFYGHEFLQTAPAA